MEDDAGDRGRADGVAGAAAVHDLENTLTDLVALLRAGDEKAGTLHPRVQQQLAVIERLANRPSERDWAAGFGLGVKRTVQFASGMQNIRDVISFPRTLGNAEF